jgi:predicted flap endonuclease-1-like 5' DNA nuclease
MTSLISIEGIGTVYKQKLEDAGVKSVEALLQRGATPRGRKELAELTGAGDERILDWVNRADLYRIKGVGEEYSDLLERAGVDTVVELSQRNPDNLHAKMREVNEEEQLVRRLPTQAQVHDWVRQAKDLPRGVSY